MIPFAPFPIWVSFGHSGAWGALGMLGGFLFCALYYAACRARGHWCPRLGHRSGMMHGGCGYCGFDQLLYPHKGHPEQRVWLPHRFWCQL